MRTILFLLLLALPAQAVDRLIGGTVVDKAFWPASVYASMGNSRCTATVVGEKVLLIAAHCVGNGGTASFSAGGQSYSAKCTHAPDYDRAIWEMHRTAIVLGQVPDIELRNSTADWALCVINKPVTGVPFENVNQDPLRFKVGDELTLTGYGCLAAGGGGGGNDGKYRIGTAKIQKVPSGSSNDIVTYGSAALCFGDSGGPAFFISGSNRWTVSVNSRGNIKDTSYLSSVSTVAAKAFFSDWATRNNVEICGIHSSAKGCRGGTPPPPPRPVWFEIKGLTHRAKVRIDVPAKQSDEEIKARLDATRSYLDRKVKK